MLPTSNDHQVPPSARAYDYPRMAAAGADNSDRFAGILKQRCRSASDAPPGAANNRGRRPDDDDEAGYAGGLAAGEAGTGDDPCTAADRDGKAHDPGASAQDQGAKGSPTAGEGEQEVVNVKLKDEIRKGTRGSTAELRRESGTPAKGGRNKGLSTVAMRRASVEQTGATKPPNPNLLKRLEQTVAKERFGNVRLRHHKSSKAVMSGTHTLPRTVLAETTPAEGGAAGKGEAADVAAGAKPARTVSIPNNQLGQALDSPIDGAREAESFINRTGRFNVTQEMTQRAELWELSKAIHQRVMQSTQALPGRETQLSLDFTSRVFGDLGLNLKEADGRLSVLLSAQDEQTRQELQQQREELERNLRQFGYSQVDVNVQGRDGDGQETREEDKDEDADRRVHFLDEDGNELSDLAADDGNGE